ncbi:MAG TPA: hypothetical protein VHV83_01225 [Armatimonadota bacterium]|nr:hypothetical protein [Armatimonadota bacterium]
MTKRAIGIGLALWAVDLLFVLFMLAATDVEHSRYFWPVVIALLVVLLPVNLYVGTRMPGTEQKKN